MKKKRHKKKRGKLLLLFFAALVLVCLIVIFGFRTKDIQVTGNSYYSENSIVTWINNDKLSVNSLYILMKYRFTDAALPSGVESLDVSLKSPQTVKVKVKEKSMAGYIDYDNAYLYFDREGIASLRTKKVLEGVPYIEGMEVDLGKVKIGKALPAEDKKIFQKIVEVSKYLKKYHLTPDRMSCPQGEINLTFGAVTVLLGTENYEDRLAQVGPILDKLAQQYPDQAGTLHLENYGDSDTAIRFVPESEE